MSDLLRFPLTNISLMCLFTDGAVFVSVHFLVSELGPAVLSSGKKMFCRSVFATGKELLKCRAFRIDEHDNGEILYHHSSDCFRSEVVISDNLRLYYTF